MSKYCFVIPRSGDFAGGAEGLVRQIATKLVQRGEDITILATCAKDNRTWENSYKEGATVESGIKVERYLVDQRDTDTWVPLQIKLTSGQELTIDEQLEWIRTSVNSQNLYNRINELKDEMDLFFFAPYLFGTTFFGSQIVKEKAVLIPCLHDESYAYLDIMSYMFSNARACMFNAKEEKDLASKLYGSSVSEVVGLGFDNIENNISGKYFKEDFRYFLYLGRKETGKNLDYLVDCFDFYLQENPKTDVKLVIVGGGDISDIHRDSVIKHPNIIDLSYVTEEEKQQLINNSSGLIQASVNESFSIVLMESWLNKKPVIINYQSKVTKGHVEKANAGLYFKDPKEFCAVLDYLLNNKEKAQILGINGYNYVKEEYNWDAVLKRFDSLILKLNEKEN